VFCTISHRHRIHGDRTIYLIMSYVYFTKKNQVAFLFVMFLHQSDSIVEEMRLHEEMEIGIARWSIFNPILTLS
jgi:hypothetical protein